MKQIAILDFGSQYTHLISRNVRELNVLAKIYNNDISVKELKKNQVTGIILSGGPHSVYDKNKISVDTDIFNLGVPILGLCYGHQLIANTLGGKVKNGKTGEYGPAKLEIINNSKIFNKISSESTVWMSHGDHVEKLPNNFNCIGKTADCDITAMANEEKNIYGFQFHPEVEHTTKGKKMIENFVINICNSPQDWKIDNLVDDLIIKIKKQANNKKVFILVSGGVDSSVAFALLTKALGEKNVLGLYIDTGFMRKDESKKIKLNYKKAGFNNLECIDASEIFFKRLKNIYDPEEKRHIIGQTFLDVKDETASDLKLDTKNWLLGQGTIYPDTIESGGTKHSDIIKTHHNRVDAIQKLIEQGLIIEPLVEFYKDEVRKIGELLGLSKKLINRHPFPGPGLAIRCLCHDKDNKEKKKININSKLTNINSSILPIQSVGVQGDNRTYANPLVVWGEKDWDKLDDFSSTTTNSNKNINRVILLLNNTNNSEFKLLNKNCYLDQKRISLLQDIDDIVMSNIKKAGIYDEIWQFPVILIPITNGSNKESIVLRPFVSRDVMTLKFARLEKKLIKKITAEILATKKISYVFYDITNKPPGTVEWE